jgi:GT2 family glycosyltransferase
VRLSIVIVNYNGIQLLRDCLSGLEAQTRSPDEVIVVDNASTDDSQKLIRQEFPWVHLIESSENLGFASGNNLGIRSSCGDVVILLNNDTVPSPGFVEAIAQPLEDDPSLSAVSGTMLFSEHVNLVATCGIEIYENGLALDRSTGENWRSLVSGTDVFGPSGGAMAIRRPALFDVELFPEPFFLYLEDADLAWRMRLRGHRTVLSADAWVHHVYSASAGEGSPFKDYFLARNRAWTLIRCWPDEIWYRNWPLALRYEIGAVVYSLMTWKWASIRGRIDGWLAFRRLRRVRRYIQSRSTASPEELLYWLRSEPSVRDILRGRRVIDTLTRRSPANERCRTEQRN